jgi:hypothetical protein
VSESLNNVVVIGCFAGQGLSSGPHKGITFLLWVKEDVSGWRSEAACPNIANITV